jgi:hypothetical protein
MKKKMMKENSNKYIPSQHPGPSAPPVSATTIQALNTVTPSQLMTMAAQPPPTAATIPLAKNHHPPSSSRGTKRKWQPREQGRKLIPFTE